MNFNSTSLHARGNGATVWKLTAMAAVVVAALGWTTWRAYGAGASPESGFVAVEPTRVLDTRDGTDVGLAGPFVSDVNQKLQITGTIPTTTGSKTVVPAGATGVVMNVTVVDPSAAGFVAIRPGDQGGATGTSNLNFGTGAIVPNAVTVQLPTSGASAGMIDVLYHGATTGSRAELLIDVVGYLVPQIQPLAGGVEIADAGDLGGDTDPHTVGSITVVAPAPGTVVVNSSATASAQVAGTKLSCVITTGTTPEGPLQIWESAGNDGSIGVLAGSRSFAVGAGSTSFNYVCQRLDGAPPPIPLSYVSLTYVYVPD